MGGVKRDQPSLGLHSQPGYLLHLRVPLLPPFPPIPLHVVLLTIPETHYLNFKTNLHFQR